MNSSFALVSRKKLASWLGAARRKILGLQVSKELRDRLDADGYVCVSDFLSPDHFALVKEELSAGLWPFIEMTQWPANTLRVNLDSRLCIDRFPGLHRILECKRLRRVLEYTAGYPGSPLIALQIVKSEGVEAGQDPQTRWHCDTYHGLAKAWLFLHEVRADQGPFAYIPGSHRPSSAHWDWDRQTGEAAAAATDRLHAKGSFRIDETGLAALGYGEPFVAVVPANTLVVADTSGFHRRTPSPKETIRMEIYFTLRRNPFIAILFPSLLGLPFIRRNWAGWAYRHFERLVAKGIPGWIPLGHRRLTPKEAMLIEKASSVAGD